MQKIKLLCKRCKNTIEVLFEKTDRVDCTFCKEEKEKKRMDTVNKKKAGKLNDKP